ncbi:type II secretion system F family protein [Candidatus Peregrinibacteria bacterium]|nr:type II secretion system F family protein [Candidatus Peregrinibacteria bacterium]
MEIAANTKQEQIKGSDYIVDGAVSYDDLLDRVKNIKVSNDDGVVYGIYNNAGKGLGVRFNDFLIDRSKVRLKEKSYFFHMLSVMVDAGITVLSALKSLAKRSDNPRFARVLRTLSYNCENGSNLADAMTRFEDVFDETEVGVVQSGEATGRLNFMLSRLSEQLDKKHDLYLKLLGAAFYPVVVLGLLIIVSIGMLTFVFPSLLELLKSGGVFNADLPLATRALIAVQGFVVNFWWIVLIVISGLYGMFKVYIGSEYGAIRWDMVKLRIPVIGQLLRRVYVLNFVNVLGLLIDSGLPVIRALQITGKSISNRVYKLKIQEIINAVKEGGKISESMSDTEFLFPHEVTEMIRVGETSASLAKVAQKVGDQYQREIDSSLKRLSSVFGPVMILIVGVFVGLIALAIMAPIFNIGSAFTS